MKLTYRGLVIKSPWIDKILNGEKTWEIRGSNSNIRGKIALIKSGSGEILGTCELVDSIGPLSIGDLTENVDKHGVVNVMIEQMYEKSYAWVVESPQIIEHRQIEK